MSKNYSGHQALIKNHSHFFNRWHKTPQHIAKWMAYILLQTLAYRCYSYLLPTYNIIQTIPFQKWISAYNNYHMMSIRYLPTNAIQCVFNKTVKLLVWGKVNKYTKKKKELSNNIIIKSNGTKYLCYDYHYYYFFEWSVELSANITSLYLYCTIWMKDFFATNQKKILLTYTMQHEFMIWIHLTIIRRDSEMTSWCGVYYLYYVQQKAIIWWQEYMHELRFHIWQYIYYKALKRVFMKKRMTP